MSLPTMPLNSTFEYKQHCFAVTDTIMGAIRKYNNCSLSEEDRTALMVEFNRVNNSTVPRPGSVLLIPVVARP